MAGHDTTAATVACALTLLASDPKAMAAVRAEVDDATEALGVDCRAPWRRRRDWRSSMTR